MRKTSPYMSVLAATCLAVTVMPGCGAQDSEDVIGADTAEFTSDTAGATSDMNTTDDATEGAADEAAEGAADEAAEDAFDEATDEANEDATDEVTDAGDDTAVEEPSVDEEVTWGLECTEHSDCPAPTDMCAKQPNTATGYCSMHCGSTSECHDNGAPSDAWTCNAVVCSIPAMTWCGPTTELEEFSGFLSECE